MKKSVLSIAIALLSITAMSAQEYVMFGVKGGATYLGDGLSAFNDQNTRISFNLGLLAEIPLTDKFSAQPEVLYSMQMYNIEYKNNADDIEYQLDYISIPVLAKFYVIDGLALEAGPQVGFLVNGRYNIGLTDIYDGSFSDNLFTDADPKHTMAQAGVNFIF